ncbi:ferrous iron transport protein A [Sulfurimonas sp.]|uniref:FeoA family protein n=1 Tax=Sulfurimonas sp. TaxID=2022749 RepID=UPI003563E0BA
MKTLYDCKKDDKVKVIKLYADTELKQRLISFGIMKESILDVLEHTTTKSNIEIKVGKTRLALRSAEAKMIEVEKL